MVNMCFSVMVKFHQFKCGYYHNGCIQGLGTQMSCMNTSAAFCDVFDELFDCKFSKVEEKEDK